MQEQVPARSDEAPILKGVWLTEHAVRTSLEEVLMEMLEPNQPRPDLRRSLIEELSRPVKLTRVIVQYLGLEQLGADAGGEIPFVLVAPKHTKGPWEAVLLRPGSDGLIGIVVNTRDHGRVALVHKVFAHFSDPLKHLIRRYAVLAADRESHEGIVDRLCGELDHARLYTELMTEARRHVQMLDPSVLFGPDGEIRVQLGSVSQTVRSLLREDLRGEQLFILPHTLFESGTNYGDIEFLIYLNFFLGEGSPTRIVGTAHQKRTFYRLLTLVIFGIFDPEAPAPPSFEQLRQAYGVPDPDAFHLFRQAFELYAARQRRDATSPLRRLDDYVDFTVLSPGETVVPIARRRGDTPLGQVRLRPHPPGGFDVRIVLGDGRSSEKRMEVTPPARKETHIPAALRRPLQFATSRPRFGVTPLGSSHGFDPLGDLTSFVIWINGKGFLVDPSPEALTYLRRIGVAPVDIPYVFLTHVHADHDGGLLEKLLSWSRTTLIASDVVFRAFLEKAELITGHDFGHEGLVKHLPANPGPPLSIEVGGDTITVETRWNLHPIPTNGFKIGVAGRTFGYSGDTQYDPELLTAMRERHDLTARQYEDLTHFFWAADGTPRVDLLYHEAGIPPVHTDRRQLETLSPSMKARTFLVHVADKDVPPGAVPSKPPLFSTQALLPPTTQSREAILLDTMRLVSYLHDVPTHTLETLLRGAEICSYHRHALIVRRGPLGEKEPLHFFIIADGEVSVKEGGVVKTRLKKADTFGEWGISHQRGYRVADVVASRPCQCIRLSEAQYWWLVERHPAVQERVAKIRALLPRLEMARDRHRLQGRANVSSPLGLMTRTTSGQLAKLAMFGELRNLKKNQTVIVEGEEPDGFFILLSGHLSATVGGWVVGELSEGDSFGEIALLEGGKRHATIRVVSVDAEVLFMRTRDFRRLLETLPAFSWGIWEMAGRRRHTSGQSQAAHEAKEVSPADGVRARDQGTANLGQHRPTSDYPPHNR